MTSSNAGYVDLQVNGYAGLDFNSETYSADDLANLCQRLRADGVGPILATIITAPLPKMLARIARVAAMVANDAAIADMVTGIHVEGPFISPLSGYVGAHPVDAVLPATADVAKRLVDSGQGLVKLVTLAPEADDRSLVTKWLSAQNILVAGGHSNASLADLQSAVDAGLRMYTHLGNGCPPTLPRHDNIIQRVLSLADTICISFIADGHHIPVFALKNYLSIVPAENVVIVTDAISAAGLGPGRYQLSDQIVEVDDAGAAWSADRTHFAGSAATMPTMVSVLQSIGIADELIAKWTCDNPRRLLGM
ncbi:MAG: N-acetylglucosamine-6-phosphate deacetylase [Planctomycetaceae bacterium]